MTTEDVKQYLQKEIPDFEYKTSDLPENMNKIWIEREGQKLVIDVQKVETEKDAKQLRNYIEGLWKQYEKAKASM